MRQGIDVSGYQHPNNAPIDYQQVAKAGYSWVAVKVNEGAGSIRSDLKTDVQGFAAVDCEVCLYHYARPTATDPERAAQTFAALCPASPRLARRILDLEDGAQLGWDALARWVEAFVPVAQVSILYVNRYYRGNLEPHGFPWGCDVWLADPDDPNDLEGCYAVQYGQGPVPGVAAVCDLNHVTDTIVPPTVKKDENMISFQYNSQLHTLHVDDQGSLVHHWHDGATWHVEYPVLNVTPRAIPTVQAGYTGDPLRLDVFVEAGAGVAHGWYLPDHGWQSETL